MLNRREAFLKKAQGETREALRSKDVLLANTARAIEELNQVTNLLYERLQTIYAFYFPELDVKDPKKYAEMVTLLDRKQLDIKELAQKLGQEKAQEIVEKAQQTLGIDMTESDLRAIRAFAQQLRTLYALRDEYDSYQEQLAKEICPNITYVTGADIAAKLIAHVGSLARLAILPASTIQVLGAEKALFKHLRNRRIAPPKHGILFQHVRISSSPKKVRGKIARALANKIALAARADGFTRRFIAEKLKKDLDERYQEIMNEWERGRKKVE